MSRIRTLRGAFIEGDTHRVVVDDGRLNHGYKVLKFVVAPRNPGAAGTDVWGTLSLDYDGGLFWNFDDNRQIAWSSNYANGSNQAEEGFELIDPDHIVIQDLYIEGQTGTAGGGDTVNYFILVEMVELTDEQAVLQLIKERSQDDRR
jgi:hypothetical protein